MLKTLLAVCLFLFVCYLNLKPAPVVVSAVVIKEPTKTLLKDKQLHMAFDQILSSKKKKKQVRNPSSEELNEPTAKNEVVVDSELVVAPLDNDSFLVSSEEFKYNMSLAEQTEILNNLKVEIENDQQSLDAFKNMEDEENIRILEDRLTLKKNQLRYFSSISR